MHIRQKLNGIMALAWIILLTAWLVQDAQAQDVTDDILLTYTPVTARVDGAPLPVSEISHYQFDYREAGTTSWQYGGSQLNGAADSAEFQITTAPGDYEFRARTKTEDSAEPDGVGKWSSDSDLALVTIAPNNSDPNAPTDLVVITVRVTITP